MANRAITFPKTSDGVWTNRETDVIVRREAEGRYRPMRPADVSGGYIGINIAVRTLAEAKNIAARYVNDVARPEIARSHSEALAIDAERTAFLAENGDEGDGPGFDGSDNFRTPTLAESRAAFEKAYPADEAWTRECAAPLHDPDPATPAHRKALGGFREGGEFVWFEGQLWTVDRIIAGDDLRTRLTLVSAEDDYPGGRHSARFVTVDEVLADNHALALVWESQRNYSATSDAVGWVERVKAFRQRTGCGLKEALDGAMGEAHDEALAENFERWFASIPDCCCFGRTDDDGHARRCPRRAHIIAGSAGHARALADEAAAERLRLINADHDEALREQAERDGVWRTVATRDVGGMTGAGKTSSLDALEAGLAFGRQLRPFVAMVKVVRDELGCGLREAKQEAKNRLHAEALAEQAKWDAARIIADARVPEGETCGCHTPARGVAAHGLPPVPERIDDDEAWAAYCRAYTAEPSEQEIADVLAEFGNPYAAGRTEAVAAFKVAARSIWKIRAQAPHDRLHTDLIASFRAQMRTLRGVIETYDMLSESHALATRTERDAASQTF